jgi:hypothetical protein
MQASKILFQAQVTNREGVIRTFKIVEGRAIPPKKITDIYNGVLVPLDKGIAVTEEHIASRLSRDRRSVYVGLLDGEPCSIINVARKKGLEVPDTHQALTDNETFASVLETGAESWFCPWLAVREDSRRFFIFLDGKKFSLGQLLLLRVKNDALADVSVQKLFAYSRPASIRNLLGDMKEISVSAEANDRPQFLLRGRLLRLTLEGIYYEDSGQELINFARYWDEKRPDDDNKKFDSTFQYHHLLGAEFRPDLVRPYGQIHDLLSLCYRTPLEYNLLPPTS